MQVGHVIAQSTVFRMYGSGVAAALKSNRSLMGVGSDHCLGSAEMEVGCSTFIGLR